MKRPIVVECCQWDGNNLNEIEKFVGDKLHKKYIEGNYFGSRKKVVQLLGVEIETLEGNHKARVGDYIIKGVDGEFYPCKKDIFEKTYDIVWKDKESYHKPTQYELEDIFRK